MLNGRKTRRGFICMLVALSAMALSASVRADNGTAVSAKHHEGGLLVNVKTIRAAEPYEGSLTATDAGLRIDGRLKELSVKLQKLPFRAFSLVSSETRTVPLKKKESFPISNGQVLNVRPLYAEAPKVGLWLRWLDKSGIEILDTRMHFDMGESMIVGTDNSPSSGVILVVDVTQVGDHK